MKKRLLLKGLKNRWQFWLDRKVFNFDEGMVVMCNSVLWVSVTTPSFGQILEVIFIRESIFLGFGHFSRGIIVINQNSVYIE